MRMQSSTDDLWHLFKCLIDRGHRVSVTMDHHSGHAVMHPDACMDALLFETGVEFSESFVNRRGHLMCWL